jgi:peptidoglycan hydrolase-like protein with peptidoglycan-binding domain
VREVQQVLNRLGYFAGPISGRWDRASADAMLHFQEAHGLEPTGNLNFSSIAGLGLWRNLIGNPIGNNNKALEASNSGAPPTRGNGVAVRSWRASPGSPFGY